MGIAHDCDHGGQCTSYSAVPDFFVKSLAARIFQDDAKRHIHAILIAMKSINWNPDKNQQLIEERGISFEDVVFYLQQDALLDHIKHPNANKYPNQRVFVISIDGYVHLVPYIEDR